MKYIEILTKNSKLDLCEILLAIKNYANNYIWSLQLIEAVGDIKNIVGMNMLTLEKKCNLSDKGIIMPFDDFYKMSCAFEDVIDILIIGCKDENFIPKAYIDKDWEEHCDIIISKEDSTIWQLYSNTKEIIDIFQSF